MLLCMTIPRHKNYSSILVGLLVVVVINYIFIENRLNQCGHRLIDFIQIPITATAPETVFMPMLSTLLVRCSTAHLHLRALKADPIDSIRPFPMVNSHKFNDLIPHTLRVEQNKIDSLANENEIPILFRQLFICRALNQNYHTDMYNIMRLVDVIDCRYIPLIFRFHDTTRAEIK